MSNPTISLQHPGHLPVRRLNAPHVPPSSRVKFSCGCPGPVFHCLDLCLISKFGLTLSPKVEFVFRTSIWDFEIFPEVDLGVSCRKKGNVTSPPPPRLGAALSLEMSEAPPRVTFYRGASCLFPVMCSCASRRQVEIAHRHVWKNNVPGAHSSPTCLERNVGIIRVFGIGGGFSSKQGSSNEPR